MSSKALKTIKLRKNCKTIKFSNLKGIFEIFHHINFFLKEICINRLKFILQFFFLFFSVLQKNWIFLEFCQRPINLYWSLILRKTNWIRVLKFPDKVNFFNNAKKNLYIQYTVYIVYKIISIIFFFFSPK